MKTTLIASTLAFSLAVSGSVSAAPGKSYKEEENIGFGSGLVAGALVGGPIGAMVGGITGLFIGHSVGADGEVDELSVQLAEQETSLARLSEENRELIAQLESTPTPDVQLASYEDMGTSSFAAEQAISMAFQFRSGSSELEGMYAQQLTGLAKAMRLVPELHVKLDGYADRRGAENYNLNLSQQRVDAVKQVLMSQGVDESRIYTQAFGETQPMQNELHREADFFDRRVTLQLLPQKTQTASAHSGL